jgi:protein nanos 1
MSCRQSVSSTCCKVCKDAKLPEAYYTSHNVRDAKGRIACPTLRSAKCSKCYLTGHTGKYCTKKPADAQKALAVLDRFTKSHNPVQSKPDEPVKKKKSSGMFAALMDSDSDSDSPILMPPVKKPQRCHELLNQGPTILSEPLKFKPLDPPAAKGPTILRSQAERAERDRIIAEGLRNGTLGWGDVDSDSDEEELEEVGF